MFRRALALGSLGVFFLLACSGKTVDVAGSSSSGQSSGQSSGTSGSSGASGSSSSGASGSSSSSSGGPADYTAACASVAKESCARIQSCSPILIRTAYGSVAACETRTALGCMNGYAGPGVLASPADASACAAALARTSCDDLFARSLPAACTKAGSLAQGLACGSDNQCSSGYCNRAAGQPCGTCNQRVPSGGDCTNSECVRGLACASNVCVKPGIVGATCEPDTAPCAATLKCVDAKCVVPAAANASCQVRAQNCDSLKGYYCDLSLTCKAIGYGKPGDFCGITAGGVIACEAGGKCPNTRPSRCVAAAADGATCDVAAGPDCVSPAVCSAGRCVVPSPLVCK